MGMANLIPGTGLLLEHKADKSRDVVEFLGPIGSLGNQAIAGVGKLLGGDIAGAGKEMAPLAIQNVLKSVDMMKTGTYRDKAGRTVKETDTADAIWKGIGFQPNVVAETQRRTNIVNQDNMLAMAKESVLADRWAEARFKGDTDAEDKVKADLAKWNEANPGARIVIKMVDIRKRVINMRRDKDERTLKQATPEMRAYTRAALNG
jgi:hypothetical protein